MSDILRDFKDGDERGWQTEFDDLWERERDYLARLSASIQEHGFQQPILLGTDGRVWNGHHRLAIAISLGIESVPVIYTG